MANNVKLKPNVYMTITPTLIGQNISNNTSQVKVVVNLRNPGGTFYYGGIGPDWRIRYVIKNGSTVLYDTGLINFEYNLGSINVIDREFTINHNTDGTQVSNAFSVTITGEASQGLVYTSGHTADTTLSIATIPRVSQPTLSNSSRHIGQSVTIYTNRASSSFTHKLYYRWGSGSWVLIADGIGTSYTWSIPTNLLAGGYSSRTLTFGLDTFSGTTMIGTGVINMTVTVPISTFTIPTSFTMGNAFTVTISRVGSLTHWVRLSDGSVNLFDTDSSVGTSQSVNVALSTLAARSPNAMSKVFKVTVWTYNGNTIIGSTSKNITAYVPTSLKPTFSAVTVSENVSSVATLIGAYVQTQSKLNLAITGASGIYGSTIKSYNITGVGHNVNSSSTVTGYLAVSGNQTIKGTVIDSRGQSFEKSIVINILPYTPPVVTNLSFRRTLPDKTEAPLGDNVTVRANVKVQSLIVNGVEKNSIWYQVQSAQSGGSFENKANTTSTSLTKNYSDVWSGYSVDYSYNFRVRSGDVFLWSGWTVGVVPTGIVTQQWGSATTSFGKMIDDPSYNLQVGTGGIQSEGPIVTEQGIKSPYTTRPASANLPVTGDKTVKHFLSTSAMTEGKPQADGFITHYEWDNTWGWSSQFYVPSTIGTIGFRTMDTGVWSQWYYVFSSESGSNGNGRYIRFSDGTQICYIATTHDYTTAGDTSYTFPAAFVESPACSVSFQNGANEQYRTETRNSLVQNTSTYARFITTSTAPFNSLGIYISAIGRWK